ncbi:MAG: hypothetical protein NUV53_02305 [Patescibacteria group bacterium]|nr:hypothetical protein [Patescibacteria group bacterium]
MIGNYDYPDIVMKKNHFIFIGVVLAIVLALFVVVRDSASQRSTIKNPTMLLQVATTTPMVPQFELPSLRWEQVPSSTISWEARDSHALTVFNDALWIMGGLNGNGLVTHDEHGKNVAYWDTPHFNDVWTSADGYEWKLITDNAPWGNRRSLQAVEFKGRLWLMGGWGPEVGHRSDVWVSDDGAQWERATAKAEWPAREGHSLLVWNDRIWLIGGVRYDTRETFNDAWYSDDGVHWTEAVRNASWISRWDHSVAVFNNKLYLTAGMDLNGATFDDVWVSDDGETWTLVTDTPPWRERQGHVLVSYHDALWTLGRFNDSDSGSGPNDVWFTKDGVNWEKTDSDPLWLGREDHGAVVWRDKMWVVGGMDSNWQWNNDVWYTTFGK